MADRTALLLGATGLVGSHCLRVLLADERYRTVTVLLRRSLPEKHPNLIERVVDFDRMEVQKDLFAVDDIFCCLGTTIRVAGSQEAFRKVDYSYPAEAARLGAAAGARQFLLVSSIGANSSSRIFYTRVKGEIEEAVRTSGIPGIAIFRPSLILGERREPRSGEKLATAAIRALGFALVGPARKYRGVEASTIARAMSRVAAEEVPGVRIIESDSIEQFGGR